MLNQDVMLLEGKNHFHSLSLSLSGSFFCSQRLEPPFPCHRRKKQRLKIRCPGTWDSQRLLGTVTGFLEMGKCIKTGFIMKIINTVALMWITRQNLPKPSHRLSGTEAIKWTFVVLFVCFVFLSLFRLHPHTRGKNEITVTYFLLLLTWENLCTF